jgi:response regulator RpfG family c-di-GMP phosphodiesterase
MANKNCNTHSMRGKKGTILLVGKKIGNGLTKRLLSYNYKVIAVEDGFEALETLKTQNVDLIISRIDLPKMDCLELMMNLRDLNIKSPLVILDSLYGEKGGTSVSAPDIWGYCYSPAVKATMMETLNCIKENGK